MYKNVYGKRNKRKNIKIIRINAYSKNKTNSKFIYLARVFHVE